MTRSLLTAIAFVSACSLTSVDDLQSDEELPTNVQGRANGGTNSKLDAGTSQPKAGGTSKGGSTSSELKDAGSDPGDGDPGAAGANQATGGSTSSGGGSGNGDAGTGGGSASSGGSDGSGGSAGQSGCTTNCPKELRLAIGDTTPARGGTGGSPYTDLCPSGDVLIGYTGYVAPNGWIESIAGICGSVTLSGSSYTTVTIARSSTLPLRGGRTGMAFTRTCGSGQVITGFDGRSGLFIDQLVFFCARLIVTEDAGTYSVSLSTRTTLQGVGNAEGGSAFNAVTCAPPQFARGSSLRSGAALDAIALVCGKPSVVDATP